MFRCIALGLLVGKYGRVRLGLKNVLLENMKARTEGFD
jgi:hypothetical protein